MKRSEMLASLTGYLMDYKNELTPEDSVKFNAQDLAKFVLDCVERKGMECKWEKEDEKS